MTVRPTLATDLPLLPAIERSAAQAFRQYPALAWLADSEVMDETAHAAFFRAGTSWVAVDAEDRPSGFLCATRIDTVLHIDELSVRQDAQGRGLGRQLLDRAVAAARQFGLQAVTLTTFGEVPWNGPFYQRYGFEQLGDAALDQRLKTILAAERAHGLEDRCAMRLAV
ncbi:GNAT family N-acetyltransferase [Pseudomonas sichuanensis]|uniref:GNAT family N-acetyltransferase n=1 Tax=Pseudomonas sichuanensis TaxID=2213015 RepID=UPI0024468903|nr:GNAT family N-acetyltransferase [Pseudomonas sichuanensis]MDH0733008.1 GNAT family N-acetyltransferase [Pseudomonas sichuanensis]MDH1586109.1 GNAT family N-acetyltransferase [Pseudomonas sichuanensis]MDH1595793.1 GNAT family N-acetyltransferase [Pseudomonas sichuanensis]MDH1600830.1 GNAT family N-acetyltransferase [Pseudomonas sichuanensis]